MRFLDALRAAPSPLRRTVIPDIKCVSPKHGDLAQGRDMAGMARQLVQAGAPVLSVVTEAERFGGSMELLRSVCRAGGVPVLRKDFIHSEKDLDETLEAGASAILLMCSCLARGELIRLYHYATSLGLDVLFETHEAKDMELAKELGAELIGINNRDILRLECDNGTVEHTRSYAAAKPKGAYLISESGLYTREDIEQAISSGADAALVGTAIWQAEDPAAMYKRLSRRCSLKLCGIKDMQGLALCRRAGADTLGFVVEYPEEVPWNISAEEAAKLIAGCRGAESCIVTGGSPEKVISLASTLRPDIVQLHHKENLEQTALITKALERLGIRVIRTVPLDKEQRLRQFGCTAPAELSLCLKEAGVWALLIDARDASGKSTGEDSLREFHAFTSAGILPVILGGGINGDNADTVLRNSGAEYIDVMTGIETGPGVKSPELISKLTGKIGGIDL